MSELSYKIMNIQTTIADIGKAIEYGMQYGHEWEHRLTMAYKMGHRDARHVAAELAEMEARDEKA